MTTCKLEYVVVERDRPESIMIQKFCTAKKIDVLRLDSTHWHLHAKPSSIHVTVVSEAPILPDSFLDSASGIFVNLHPASLDVAPGRYPFPQLVEKEVKFTEVVLHELTSAVDQGIVLATQRYSMKGVDDYVGWRSRIRRAKRRVIEKYFERRPSTLREEAKQRVSLVDTSGIKVERTSSTRVANLSSAVNFEHVVRINRYLGGAQLLSESGDAVAVLGGRVQSFNHSHPPGFVLRATEVEWSIALGDGTSFLVEYWDGPTPPRGTFLVPIS
jgi:methionyl-tRNA formyltransferase